MGNMQSLGLGPGHALEAPRIASLRADQYPAADGTWKYLPGSKCALDVVGSAGVVNSSAETSLIAGGAVAGGFPAGSAGGDKVKLRAGCIWTPSASQTLTLNVYMGATVIATFTSAAVSSGAHNCQVDLDVLYATIAGAGAGAVKVLGWILAPAATGSGFQGPNTGTTSVGYSGGASATPAGATNAASTLDLKAQTGGANPSSGTVTLSALEALWYPKNY